LAGAFIDQGWVDELIVYQAPVLLGHKAQPSLALPSPDKLDGAPRWQIRDTLMVGQDIRVTLVPLADPSGITR